MGLIPLNDVLKIEVMSDEFGFGTGDEIQGVETGIVRELPDIMPYFGFHSFSFENSLANDEVLLRLHDTYKDLLDKRVYWKSYSERGMILKEGDKTYAFIKMTDLIAYSDADDEAINLHGKAGGSFKV